MLRLYGEKMMGVLNHIAIVVPDLGKATKQYEDLFGAVVSLPQNLDDHGVTVVFIELPNTKIELLTPLGISSPVEKFLERNPSGGIHHICYEVADISEAKSVLIEKGARIIGDGEVKIGAHGKPVIFLHPKEFNGTLIELEEL